MGSAAEWASSGIRPEKWSNAVAGPMTNWTKSGRCRAQNCPSAPFCPRPVSSGSSRRCRGQDAECSLPTVAHRCSCKLSLKAHCRRSLLSLIPLCLRCTATAAKGAPPDRTLLFPDGGHYVGEFNAQFMRHGEGVRFSADGSVLANGQFCDGKQHGRGRRFCGGDRYEGEFVAGQLSGLGAYTWANGRVFEGEFGGDDFNGLGVVWTAEGEMAKCGRWANEELTEACPVPLTKIPIGSRLSASGEPRGRTTGCSRPRYLAARVALMPSRASKRRNDMTRA